MTVIGKNDYNIHIYVSKLLKSLLVQSLGHGMINFKSQNRAFSLKHPQTALPKLLLLVI